jgi:hypothetical protein
MYPKGAPVPSPIKIMFWQQQLNDRTMTDSSTYSTIIATRVLASRTSYCTYE